jgi:hypothetical protein
MSKYPTFDNIDLSLYELVWGFYILGFLKAHRPDCEFITPDQLIENSKDTSYKWLDEKIQNILNKKKKACIILWDEDIIGSGFSYLSRVLNKYKNDPVWSITQLSPPDQKIYTHQHNIQCKIVEIPWWYLNDCLVYYKLSKKIKSTTSSVYNYMSLVGRPQQTKLDLIEKLEKYNLTQYGFITLPKHLIRQKNNYRIEPNPPYRKLANPAFPFGAHCHNGTWASSNVENFLYLETAYQDIPMVVHGDTTCGIFQSTEKSLWPLLLGKLMIVHGRPGGMAAVQRFYDVDFKKVLNMDFDQQNNDYSDLGHQARLELLVKNNVDLIKDCKEVFNSMALDLESARWTIGKNLYNFLINQLETIPKEY